MDKYKAIILTRMTKRDPVVHFEMPYKDRDRLVKFYSRAFGWKMTKLGKEMGGYVTAATAETDQKNMVKTPGAINGGFYPLKSAPQAACPSVVIAVDDIGKAMKKVKAAGGKLLGKPVEIPGIGLYVSFKDSEGNRASILQPRGM
jgi:predicted enzyme related to lactoylglutathione lyase